VHAAVFEGGYCMMIYYRFECPTPLTVIPVQPYVSGSGVVPLTVGDCVAPLTVGDSVAPLVVDYGGAVPLMLTGSMTVTVTGT
jgi:hypothetical protein